MSDEIHQAFILCEACRDNRNTNLHNAGGGTGEFKSAAPEILAPTCGEMTVATQYLRELQTVVTKIILSTAGRERPSGDDGDESYNDELLPIDADDDPERFKERVGKLVRHKPVKKPVEEYWQSGR